MIKKLYNFGAGVRVGCIALFLAMVSSGFSLPKLQLDVDPGSYDPVTQTSVATSNPFTLRALIDGSLGLSRTYYLSAAIIPGTSSSGFGSFTIDGLEYSAASGMQYGVPPVDATINDLPTHGVYPTYYAELSFALDPANTIAAYNVQDGSPGSGSLYYVDFTVNIANLFGQPNSPYAVHFDLYTFSYAKTKNLDGIKLDAFAPFSHDAQSGHGLTIYPSVPDASSTLVLLGLGLLGLSAVCRRLI